MQLMLRQKINSLLCGDFVVAAYFMFIVYCFCFCFERISMVILGVDYGYARTGLAVCDEMEILSSPIGLIKESYMPKVAKRIADVAIERKAKLIVVGLPYNMDDTKGEHALASEELAGILRDEYGFDVVLQDERLTTVEAYDLLDKSATFGKKRREAVDQVAATIILEDYIKTARKNGV